MMKKTTLLAFAALFALATSSQAWWIFGKKAAAPAPEAAPSAD